MDAVGAEVDGTARTNEVVDADSALRGEVEDAGICIRTVVLLVVGRSSEGRIFVVSPEEAAGRLAPEGEVLCPDDVPAKDDGSNGNSGKGAADGIEGGALWRSTGRVDAEGALELWRVGLPEGEDLDRILEVAAQKTVAEVWSQDLAGVDSSHEELEPIPVLRKAVAALDDRSDLEVLKAGEVLLERIGVVLDLDRDVDRRRLARGYA